MLAAAGRKYKTLEKPVVSEHSRNQINLREERDGGEEIISLLQLKEGTCWRGWGRERERGRDGETDS